jgi:hypothetical protein
MSASACAAPILIYIQKAAPSEYVKCRLWGTEWCQSAGNQPKMLWIWRHHSAAWAGGEGRERLCNITL